MRTWRFSHPLNNRATVDATSPIHLRSDIRPGDLGAIIQLHGEVYAREYGWDATFEAYVAEGLARFALSFDAARDRLWIAERDGRRLGSIAIHGQDAETAQLRWFVLHPEARGAGLGRRLRDEALAFCRERGFRTVFLWTVRGLEAAAHLYREAGFVLVQEETHARWGGLVTEQRYELTL